MSARDHIARRLPNGDRDFIPTPPFATRAFYEYVCPKLKAKAPGMSAWDPAAGHGHMCRVMEEFGHKVLGTDLHKYEPAKIWELNFLQSNLRSDLILTNPPYGSLNGFIHQGLRLASRHLALLVRVQALEGQNRYNSIYRDNPPTTIGFFSKRIPFKQGKVVRNCSAMFFHAWLYWEIGSSERKPPIWIPPNVQQRLEKDSDYEGS